MPIAWDNRPDSPRRRNKLQLIRTPRGGKLQGIFLSTEAVGVWTHYYGGRTQPCQQEECEICAHQVTRRHHVYAAIWSPETQKSVLLEMTENAGEELLNRAEQKQSIRGLKFKTHRVNMKPNAPVTLVVMEDASALYQLPPEPDVVEALLIIWHLANDPRYKVKTDPLTRVKPHFRKQKGTNGTGDKKPDQANGLEHPGRLGSANGLHQQGQGPGDLPARSPFEPTDD